MKLQILSIRDAKTEQFANPMAMLTTGQAIRSFTDEINRATEDNMLYRHPEDYALFHLGEFETNTGAYNTTQPRQLVTGLEVAAKIKE